MEIKPRPRILVVGMADSVHLGRWLRQFKYTDLDIELVSSSPHRRVHGLTKELLSSTSPGLRLTMSRISLIFSLPLWVVDRFASDWLRGALIALRILRFKPNFVHVNELQNAGYASIRAYQLLGKLVRPPLFVTNYGSEIVWFQKFPKHRKKLVRLLTLADAFSAECRRDYKLANDLGFRGIEMPLMPVAGGLDANRSYELSQRRGIALKGYQNKWGRALVVMDYLQSKPDFYMNLPIRIFSANHVVVSRINKMRSKGWHNLECFPKGALSHDKMMKLFGDSLIYIGFSTSDGIATSMLEAMANGAIPIQTKTSCADEWVEHKKTGFLLDPQDIEGLGQSVEAILSGEFDAESARENNYATIESRYSPEKLSSIAREQYLTMLKFKNDQS